MPKMKLFALSGLFFVLSFSVAMADNLYEVKCKNKECNYKAQVEFGGDFTFNRITGYCFKENKIVLLLARGVVVAVVKYEPEWTKDWMCKSGLAHNALCGAKCRHRFGPSRLILTNGEFITAASSMVSQQNMTGNSCLRQPPKSSLTFARHTRLKKSISQ